jgi:putative heme-binding domain-containing protein
MVCDMRLLALVVALPLAAQHGQYTNESKNPAIGNPEAIVAGAKLYSTSCAGCHGPDGSGGRGPNLVSRALWHPLTDEGIFNAIRNGVPGADMPPTKLPDDQTWNLVAFIHSLTGPASENKVPGDVQAGEQLFWGTKAGCSNCHSIRGRGTRMGPDLSNIGSRPLAIIRESVVTPSKDLSFLGKEGVSVTLKSGKTIDGIARNRSNYSLQIIDSKGSLHLIPMTDVKEIKVSDHSPMPDDYAKRLSRDELRDLLAYLARQTARTSESISAKETK